MLKTILMNQNPIGIFINGITLVNLADEATIRGSVSYMDTTLFLNEKYKLIEKKEKN